MNTLEAHEISNERVLRRFCPICRSSDTRLSHSVYRKEANYDLAECTRCRFVFVTNPRSDTADHAPQEELCWRFRRRHHQTRQLLLRFLPSGSSLVEIGCGRGELGYIMRYDPIRYIGYEPARGLSDFGKRHGVHIVNEFFTADPQGKVDAIVIDNVLEHVLDPMALFGEAASSVRPGGVIVVIVPNRSDIRALLPSWREQHLWTPPDHINYFSSSHLRRMFDAHGMKVRSFGFAPLRAKDYRYIPRAMLEALGISLLGHNVFAIR